MYHFNFVQLIFYLLAYRAFKITSSKNSEFKIKALLNFTKSNNFLFAVIKTRQTQQQLTHQKKRIELLKI